MPGLLWSPSSRRAWIEMIRRGGVLLSSPVALLAEGVDRNYMALKANGGDQVALLAEGVDRNLAVVVVVGAVKGRPPRGGRG